MSEETPQDALPEGSSLDAEERAGARLASSPSSSPPPAEGGAHSVGARGTPRGTPSVPPRPAGGPRSVPPARMAASSVSVPLPPPPPPPTLPNIPGLDELAPLLGASVPVVVAVAEPPVVPEVADEPTRPRAADIPAPTSSEPGEGSPGPRRQSRRTVKIPADSVPQAVVLPAPPAPPASEPVAQAAVLPPVEVAPAPPASVPPPPVALAAPTPAVAPAPPMDDIIRPQRIIEIGSVPPPPQDVLERGWTPMPPVVEQAASLVSAGLGTPTPVMVALAAPTPEIDPEPASFDDFGPLDEPTSVRDDVSTRRHADVEVPDAAPTLPRAVHSDDVEIPDAAPTIRGAAQLPWAPGHEDLGASDDLEPMVPPPAIAPPPPVAAPPKVVIAASALEPPLPPAPSGPYRVHDPETIDEIEVETTDSSPPSEEIPIDVDLGSAPAALRKPPPPPPKRGPSASIPDIGAPPVPFPNPAILGAAREPAPGGLPAAVLPAAVPVVVEEAPRAKPISDHPPAAVPSRPPPARAPATPPPTSAPSVAAAAPPAKPSPAATTTPPETRKRARSWWEDLFGDDYIRTMDRLEPKHVRKDADFIEESLALEKGAVILDLACGAGQHAVELASRGYSVVGYDLSLTQLARAADEAQDRGQKLNFLQGDMREMAFDETFDGIYCWGTSFGYFDEEKNLDVLLRAHRALRQGGMLLLDVTNRDYVAPRLPSLVWFEGEGCICMDETYFDFFTSRLRVKRTAMFDDGKSREIDYSIRLYALHELGSMLHDAGYKVVEVTGHHAHPGVFFGTESPRILIVAEKG